jgi:hypothetical protein
MHHNLTPAALAALCAVLVSGCGVPPGNPGILVATTPPGASCTLSRIGQAIATVAPTPGIALVEPAAGEITIVCSRPGFADAGITLPARDAGPSFGTFFSDRSPYGYQPQVDIVLSPGPRELAPRDLRPR